jgi:biopolymer transport protein TolR
LRLSREELVARVRQAQAVRTEQPVVIAADRSARYEDVLGVLDLLQRNGVRKVGLLARPPG